MEKAKQIFLNFGLLWLRILMGMGIAYHGFGKVFGGAMGKFTEGVSNMGFPEPLIFAWLAALSELVGGVLIVLGIFARPAAFLIFATMSVAAFVFHAKDPFTVKELALVYWTMAGALLFMGPGEFRLGKRKEIIG